MNREIFMLKFFRFLLLTVLTAVFISSCDSNTEYVYPPEDVVNRVTDFYVFEDGKSFVYLNSNMNRKYDFGELVLMEIEDGELLFRDSLLVPSISGKMAVSSDEKNIFITTRDKNGVVKAKVSGKSGSYRLQYEDGTKGDYPEILTTKKEPYALALSEDESKLMVTHILNGELSVVDVKDWKVIKTAKLKYGVTDILYDKNSGYFLASHKSSGNISLIEAKETVDEDFLVAVKELPIDLPTNGFDVRSLKQSGDGTVFYAAFQNAYDEDSYDYSYDEDTAPQIVTFKITDNALEIVRTLAVSGNLGEMAVLPYSSESAENQETPDKEQTEEETSGEKTTDDSSAVEESGGNKTSSRTGDLIFVSLPSEEKVLIVDSARNSIRDEISYIDDKNECKPYQLYAKSTGNTTGYLFVSCFQNDMVYIYGIDLMSEEIIKKIGVLK